MLWLTLYSVSKVNQIIPRVFGGLGNQLFIYAAARRLALISGADLVLDDVSGFTNDSYKRHYQLDHFNISCRKATAIERLEPFGRLRRKVLRTWNHRKPFEQRTYITQDFNVDFDPRLLKLKPRDTLYLEGYWQSEGYFKDVADTIRQDLQIKPPKDTNNLAMAEAIRSGAAVAVHVRFFDEPNAVAINNAPGDYYSRAIAKMESIVPDGHYYIFSNQPAAARARIPLPDERVTLVQHNQGDAMAYADVWLMSQCQHFIIANSTFSWWGAWLAANPAKQVIAPGFEMRQGNMWWGFKGLLPNEWIKL